MQKFPSFRSLARVMDIKRSLVIQPLVLFMYIFHAVIENSALILRAECQGFPALAPALHINHKTPLESYAFIKMLMIITPQSLYFPLTQLFIKYSRNDIGY